MRVIVAWRHGHASHLGPSAAPGPLAVIADFRHKFSAAGAEKRVEIFFCTECGSIGLLSITALEVAVCEDCLKMNTSAWILVGVSSCAFVCQFWLPESAYLPHWRSLRPTAASATPPGSGFATAATQILDLGSWLATRGGRSRQQKSTAWLSSLATL